MTLEELKREMEEANVEEINAVRVRQSKIVDELKSDAEVRCEKIRSEHLEEALRLVEAERVSKSYEVTAAIKNEVNQQKFELYYRAFAQSSDELATKRDDSSYSGIYRKLLDESLKVLEDSDVRLHIDGRDEAICRRILADLQLECEIIPDLTCMGGLNACSGDEHIVVYNTFESRLERAKEVLRLEIFSTLYGD